MASMLLLDFINSSSSADVSHLFYLINLLKNWKVSQSFILISIDLSKLHVQKFNCILSFAVAVL